MFVVLLLFWYGFEMLVRHKVAYLLLCTYIADKFNFDISSLPVRRPEFYSVMNQCVCTDNSTYEIVLCKSLQSYVKASIFLLVSVKISLHSLKDLFLRIGTNVTLCYFHKILILMWSSISIFSLCCLIHLRFCWVAQGWLNGVRSDKVSD